MKKLLTIIALIGTVCLMSATTSTPDVKVIKTNGLSYSIIGSFKPGEITTSGDYGWQGCQCYQVSGCGTAFCAILRTPADCINHGVPKPAGCR